MYITKDRKRALELAAHEVSAEAGRMTNTEKRRGDEKEGSLR
jgi:hypothetical protein